MEGKILRAYIENQRISKKKIAEDLQMSRRNLYQYFDSKALTEETKRKFEEYFGEKIFKGQSLNPIVKAAMGGNANILNDYLHEYLKLLKQRVTELENENAFLRQRLLANSDQILEDLAFLNSRGTEYLNYSIEQWIELKEMLNKNKPDPKLIEKKIEGEKYRMGNLIADRVKKNLSVDIRAVDSIFHSDSSLSKG